MDINDICKYIQSAELRAAGLILQAHDILSEDKSDRRDVVTEYDRRVQALLIEELGAAVPGARFFCEETDERERADSERLFVIDPIDGTMNFVRGFGHSCISVAYAERGQALAGAVYNPYLREMFCAVRGGGAYLNGRRLRIRDVPLRDSVVCFGTAPYRPDLSERTFRLARALFDASLDVRREGSAALDLCSVAAGRAGLYVELDLSLWDHAAGALIAAEAGAVCLTPEGAPLPFTGEKSGIAAGTPRAMQDYLDLAEGME